MAQPTFEDFFTKAKSEIPKPKPLPRGHYVLALRGAFKRPPRSEGKAGQVSFLYEAIEPTDDVDPSELEALGEGYSIKDNKINVDFWLGEWADVLKIYEHLAIHGVDVDNAEDLNPALKEAINKRVVAYVTTETYMHKVKGMQTKDVAKGFKAIQ